MIINFIEQKTEKLLTDKGFFKAPVDIFGLVKSFEIELTPILVDDSISGLINMEGGKAKIGYNRLQSENRQRFTVAHEFGHYFLHSKSDTIFINHNNKTLYRDFESSTGEVQKEREANAFAAAILMPEELIKKAIKKSTTTGIGLIDELAKKFKVSSQAMSIRLSNLGIMDYDYINE